MYEMKTLDTEDAQKVIAAVIAYREQMKHRGIAVVVVDKYGDVIAGLRTTGMHGRYFKAAQRKAYSAAVMERDTSALMDFWNQQQSEGMRGPSDWNDVMLTSLHGGLCIQFGKEIVGGIGCAGGSGGDPNNPLSDWAFAEAGLRGLGEGFTRGARGR